MGNIGAWASFLIKYQEKTLVIEGEARMVGVLVSQDREGFLKAVLTLVRSNVGFIFKIRYHWNCLTLSVGLAGVNLFAMVSTGSRSAVPFRVGAQGENLATGTVWKVRACGKRVTETYGHQRATTVLQTLNRFIAATNKEPCLA